MILALAMTAAAARAGEMPANAWLDGPPQPAWSVLVEYVDAAKVDMLEGDEVSSYNLVGGGGLYFAEAMGGEVEVGGVYALTDLSGGAGLDLPDLVADLHLEAGYTWRHWDGRALRVRLQPGLYGEVDADPAEAVRVPFEICGVQALGPRLAGLLGVAVYPGFTRGFDPRFGLRYTLTEVWLADLAYPESRLYGQWAGGQEFYLRWRADPVNEFWLEEEDGRQSFRWEETRVAVGGGLPIGPWLRARVELGYVFSRSLDFGRGTAARGLEDALVLGGGVSGAW